MLRIAGIAAVAALAWPAAAQDDALTVEVGKCVDIQAPDERLACFEAQVEEARKNPPPAAAPGSAALPPAAPGSAAPPPEDVVAKVAELREVVPNRFLITLDNGQVWRQTQPEYYPLRPGSEVRIYYSRWRAFRLTNEDLRGFIHVERVR